MEKLRQRRSAFAEENKDGDEEQVKNPFGMELRRT
jgi:hypothetical protein